MESVKIEKMDIRVRCIGIIKRQRTVKVHNLDLICDIPYSDINLEDYVERAKIIAKSRMRTIEKCEVYLSPWTQIPSDGYSMKEVRMCDPRYKKLTVEV